MRYFPLPLLITDGVYRPSLSVRIGVVYFITSFAILTGTPIAGALFEGDNWGKPVAFSGVRRFFSLPFISLYNMPHSINADHCFFR